MVTAARLVTRRLALEPLTTADVPAIYDIAREKRSIIATITARYVHL